MVFSCLAAWFKSLTPQRTLFRFQARLRSRYTWPESSRLALRHQKPSLKLRRESAEQSRLLVGYRNQSMIAAGSWALGRAVASLEMFTWLLSRFPKNSRQNQSWCVYRAIKSGGLANGCRLGNCRLQSQGRLE